MSSVGFWHIDAGPHILVNCISLGTEMNSLFSICRCSLRRKLFDRSCILLGWKELWSRWSIWSRLRLALISLLIKYFGYFREFFWALLKNGEKVFPRRSHLETLLAKSLTRKRIVLVALCLFRGQGRQRTLRLVEALIQYFCLAYLFIINFNRNVTFQFTRNAME